MADLIGQVHGLATVHSLLSASEWMPLPLSELATSTIRSVLQTLPHVKQLSVEVTPSPIHVTAKQANNLALVISELATNAVKHGLHNRDAVQVTVHIALEEDTVCFEFRDDGPGFPGEVLRLERYDVGFDLLQTIVRDGLEGELSLRNEHGAVVEIRFPAQA
jgi:two-component sensor histidine kinase